NNGDLKRCVLDVLHFSLLLSKNGLDENQLDTVKEELAYIEKVRKENADVSGAMDILGHEGLLSLMGDQMNENPIPEKLLAATDELLRKAKQLKEKSNVQAKGDDEAAGADIGASGTESDLDTASGADVPVLGVADAQAGEGNIGDIQTTVA